MSDVTPTTTRRSFLKRTAALGAAAVAGVSASAGTAAAGSGWTAVETPVDVDLNDLARTGAGVYAVGDGGVVPERTSDGWRKLLDGGPTGNGNDLYGAGVTDDGDRLWFVGASGAIGEYDVAAGVLTDHSAPNDGTNNFDDVAVTGGAGEAAVYVADDSGIVHYSFENGESGTWDSVTPGSGSSLQAIDFYDARAGALVDTDGKTFGTDDGTTWEAIGIPDANVNFYGVVAQRATARQTESDDVDADAADDVTVVGGGGMVFDYDGADWTPTDLGDASLRDVELAGGDGLAVGDGGVVFAAEDGRWTAEDTPTGANLAAVLRGAVDVAVGASGTVIERR